MIKYIKFFLRFSKLILLGTILLTLFLGYHATQIRFDFSMEALFQTESQERQDYEWFRKNFGSDDAVIFVAYKAPNVLGKEMRDYAEHLTRRLSSVKGIEGVTEVEASDHEGLVTLKVTSEQDADIREEVTRAIVEKNWGLREVRAERIELAEIFARLTGSREE